MASLLRCLLLLGLLGAAWEAAAYSFTPASACSTSTPLTITQYILPGCCYYDNNTGGNCNFGAKWGAMPNWPKVYIAAASDKYKAASPPGAVSNTGEANRCGVCYELVGPLGAIRVIIADGLGDGGTVPVDKPHFDLGGGKDWSGFPLLVNKSAGIGAASVGFREVACDFSGNIQMVTTTSGYCNNYWIVYNHVTGLANVEFNEANSSTWIQLTRQSDNRWYIANVPGGCWNVGYKMPLIARLTSFYGDVVNCTLNYSPANVLAPNTRFECSGQFSTLPQHPCEGCCNPPDMWSSIYTDSLQGYWEKWQGSPNLASSPGYGGSGTCIYANMSQYDTVGFGCNNSPRVDQYQAVEFMAKIGAGATTITNFLFRFNSPSGKMDATLDPVSDQWTKITVDIPLNYSTALGTYFNDFFIQTKVSGRTLLYLDDIKLIPRVDAPSIAKCADANVVPLPYPPCPPGVITPPVPNPGGIGGVQGSASTLKISFAVVVLSLGYYLFTLL